MTGDERHPIARGVRGRVHSITGPSGRRLWGGYCGTCGWAAVRGTCAAAHTALTVHHARAGQAGR